ncbi:hypothetical protein Slin15195_G103340 [Septoria linicola]|uniref:Uncharacterized protein n=1 Tax=Septoria linicola TaxID=215465 RepID=A0A9Q9ENF7_9PEZI|nr:hypothetical protein Slin15195_G103340 [Septoria linicola]
MADEALTCFTSLLENGPGWIADLDSLLDAVKGRQQEILFANQPAAPGKSPSRAASKSSSLRSSRSRDGDDKSGRLRPALKHLTNSDALRLSQRKRKTASVASGDQSGPCKFRNRASAMIYYDGDTQKHFEKLVRAIGTSRNSIRKGKMSAKVDALSRSGSSSSRSSCSSDGDDEDYSKITVGLKYRSTRTRLPGFGRSDGVEAYDKVDGRLEKGQSLCERAAHQVLRDGDCTLEVSRAKEHFSEALKMVTEELPAVRKRAEKAVERRRRSAEQHRLEEDVQNALRAAESVNDLDKNVQDLNTDIAVPNDDGELEVDILEVDDAESSSDGEEFNITSFTFTKAGGRFAPQMRTSRLAVH